MSEETKLGETTEGSRENFCNDSGRCSDSGTGSYNDGQDNAGIIFHKIRNSDNHGCQNNSGNNGRHININNNNDGSGDIDNGSNDGGKTGLNDGCVSSNDISNDVREGTDIDSDEDKVDIDSDKQILAEVKDLTNKIVRESMEKHRIIKQLQRKVRKQAAELENKDEGFAVLDKVVDRTMRILEDT